MVFAAVLALTCIAIDGDTLRCGQERVRLVGIDAPEMPGDCASVQRMKKKGVRKKGVRDNF